MPAIGASGILGIAPEAISGTYVAPTKFIPFDSESLKKGIEIIIKYIKRARKHRALAL